MADKLAGVIGCPVSHSLSPKLHGFWLKEYGIDGEYIAKEVAPEALGDFIRRLPESGWRGCNITLPHKEAALEILNSGSINAEVDNVAQEVGAVNTIVVKENGKLWATNTDVYGFTENIRSHITKKNKAVVLGAGGAAQAVWYSLLGLEFSEIIVANRTHAKVSKLKGKHYTIHLWEDRSTVLKDADLLVNATSLGMTGKDPLDIDLSLLPKHALVTDIVYTPLMTELLKNAKARGNPVVDGLGMLLYQAVPGFAAWFGQTPEVTDALRHHILRQ